MEPQVDGGWEMKIELVIDGEFLDEHTMGELEDKIWQWLEEFGVFQGEMKERGLRLRIVLERDGRG